MSPTKQTPELSDAHACGNILGPKVENAINLIKSPTNKKRAAVSPLSAERENHKLAKNTPPSPTTSTPPIVNMNAQSSQQNDRPRMIRERPGDIGQNNCANFFYARKEITEKDATQDIDLPTPANPTESMARMSDVILNNKHNLINVLNKCLKQQLKKTLANKKETNAKFLDNDSPFFNILNTQILSFINTTLDQPEIKTYTHEHYNNTLHIIQGKIQEEINRIITQEKEIILSFITHKQSGTELFKNFIELSIENISMDNQWKTAIYNALPTHKSNTSIQTLAKQLNSSLDISKNNQAEIKELEHCMEKAATHIGHIKSNQAEQRYKAIETQIRMHQIKEINSDDRDKPEFIQLSYHDKQLKIKEIIETHTKNKSNCKIEIFEPKGSGKFFDPLALITFPTTNEKYSFESAFAAWKRSNPRAKLSISRPTPAKGRGDDGIPDIQIIRKHIAQMYNTEVIKHNSTNPDTPHNYKPLNNEQMENIPVNQKVKYRPFAQYWEFLCPSNNITFMNYTPGTNPFINYNFGNLIANPITEREAAKDARYKERYPPRQRGNNRK